MSCTQDIVIVGAGPSGLALAAELRRLGHSPTVFDRQAEGANTSRAAVVQARTLEALEPLGVVPALLSDGIKVPIFRIRDRDNVLAEIDFQKIDSRYNFTLMCPQNQMERHLLERLQAMGGAVKRPAEVLGISASADAAELSISTGGRVERMETAWLVGCDGASSVVRQQTDIPFEGGAYAQSFVLADVRMEWPFDNEEVSLFFAPEGLVVVAPLPDNRYRIVATVDDALSDPSVEFFEALLHRRGPSHCGRIAQAIWTSRFRVQHRVARSLRKGRVLLCGDAAHVHSPAGGQGMNTGIQDAVSLARALDAVLRGGGEAGLDEWARSRHAVAKDVVATTDRMTRIATVRSAAGRSVRNSLISFFGQLPPLRSAFARNLAELGH
jgi:2-polyprenyl-6-methoxyphenol hydroxylase-like FAD-dependent oxidoreductase